MAIAFTLGPFDIGLPANHETQDPEIAARGDGGFSVVWSQYAPGYATGFGLFSAAGVQLRLGALSGGAVPDVVQGNGTETLVFFATATEIRYSLGAVAYGLVGSAHASSAASVSPYFHAAVRLSDDSVLLAWTDSRNGPADFGNVYARRLTLDGVGIGGDFLVASGPGFQGVGSTDPISVAALAGGAFAIAWITDSTGGLDGTGSLQFRTYSAAGVGNAAITVTNNGSVMFSPVKIMGLANGNVAIAYAVTAQDTTSDALVAVYRPDGTLIRTVSLETATTGNAGWQHSYDADIEALDDGGFAVAWTSQGSGSTARLRLATFDAQGLLTNDAFNIDTVGTNHSADLARLVGGDLAVVWKDSANGSSGPLQVAVLDLDANTAPLLGAGRNDRVFSWTATIAPLADLTLTDPDTQTATAVVRIQGGAARGTFINAAAQGWAQTTEAGDTVYTRSFAQAADIGAVVQQALRTLVFDPVTTGTTSFTVTVTDGAGAGTTSGANPFRVTALNSAPFDLALSSNTVPENSAAGTIIGVLIAQDSDLGDTLTFSVAPNDHVELGVDGVSLVVKPGAVLDYEALTAFVVVVQATDGAGASTLGVLNISVTDVTELGLSGQGAPIGFSWTTDVAPLMSLVVTDGAQAGLSVLVRIEDGVLRGDFHAATAAGWGRTVLGDDIVYERDFGLAGAATVQAALRGLVFDPAGVGSTAFHVTLTDGTGGQVSTGGLPFGVTAINSAPLPATPPPVGAIEEHSAAGTSLGALGVTDPDPDDPVTLNLLPGSPFALAEDNRTLIVADPSLLDYERATTVSATIIATDSGGLTSSATYVFTVLDIPDVFAPTITGITPDSGVPGDRVTNVIDHALTGTAREAGAQVEVFRDGQSIGIVTADGFGHWSLTNAGAGLTEDGLRSYAARTLYNGGVVSPLSDSVNVRLDTLAPSAVQITAASALGNSVPNRGYTSARILDLFGQADPLQALTILRDGVEIGVAQADALGNWHFLGAGDELADGLYRFDTRSVDLAGNVSPPSTPFYVTVDTVAPAVPTILGITDDTGRSATDAITRDRTLSVHGTGEVGSRVTLTRDSIVAGNVTVAEDGTWVAHVTQPLFERVHRFEAFATDRAGNFLPLTDRLDVTVDLTAPHRPVFQVSTDDGPLLSGRATRHGELRLDGTAEAHSIITIHNGNAVVGTTLTSAEGVWSHITQALPDGRNELRVVATDIAGNVSHPSFFYVRTDTTPPDAPSNLAIRADTGRSNSDLITSVPRFWVVGTAEPGTTVTVLIDGVSVGTARVNGAGAFSMDATGLGLSEGSYSLSAFATDDVGNVGATSTSRPLVIDTTAPDVPVVVTTSAPRGNLGNIAAPVIHGTAEADADVRILLHGRQIGTTRATPDGAWSFPITGSGATMLEGPNALRAIAVDAAGNASPMSARFDYVLDTTPPTMPGVVAVASGPDGPILSLVGEPGSQVQVTLNSAPGPSVVIGSTGTAALVLPASASLRLVELSATDAAGNTTSSDQRILLATSGHDAISNPPAGLQVHGLEGRDTLTGGTANDTLSGDEGDDLVIGGGGHDRLFGGDGNDVIWGDARIDAGHYGPRTAVAASYYSGSNALITGLGGTQGFGETTLAGNDDGSTGQLDVRSVFGSAGLNFFGNWFTSLYLNNNGNITFQGPYSAYTPTSLHASGMLPIIAVFWDDISTVNPTGQISPGGTSRGTNRVYFDSDPVNGVLTFTWDDVGEYPHYASPNAFQLQLVSLGAGDFDIIFRYEYLSWGADARAGWNSGSGNSGELGQSGTSGMVTLDTLVGNTGTVGVHVFNVRAAANSAVGNDILNGGAGNDTLIGGAGADTLMGGGGSDRFVFHAPGDSSGTNPLLRDTIADFEVGVDRVDLSGLSAYWGVALHLQGTLGAAFSGAAGEVRLASDGASGTVLSVDGDGNRTADFSVLLEGQIVLTVGLDLLL